MTENHTSCDTQSSAIRHQSSEPYVSGNPVNYRDPGGNFAWWQLFGDWIQVIQGGMAWAGTSMGNAAAVAGTNIGNSAAVAGANIGNTAKVAGTNIGNTAQIAGRNIDHSVRIAGTNIGNGMKGIASGGKHQRHHGSDWQKGKFDFGKAWDTLVGKDGLFGSYGRILSGDEWCKGGNCAEAEQNQEEIQNATFISYKTNANTTKTDKGSSNDCGASGGTTTGSSCGDTIDWANPFSLPHDKYIGLDKTNRYGMDY